MNETVLLYAIPLNIINFLLFGYDKFQAKKGGWRIPERLLLTLSLLGGGVGGLAGMLVFRHKTRKTFFWIVEALGIVILVLMVFS